MRGDLPLDERAFAKIMESLEENYPLRVWAKELTPFEVLVSTILSQATERRGNIRAFENLRRRFHLTPTDLAKADLSELSECIRPAGLQHAKAAKIKELARILLEEYEGDLMTILRLPEGEAREKLLRLPGVGPKTADVMLNFVAGCAVFPVDTHIARIAKRLGVVESDGGYEEIKAAMEKLIPPPKRQRIHLILIEHGREICRVRPNCEACPIQIFCERRGL